MPYIKRLIFILFILSWCNCSHLSDEDVDRKSEIDVERLALSFDAESSYQSLTVSSRLAFTVATSHPEWCVATVSNYSTHNLMVTVSKNENFDDRSATVTISAQGAKDVAIAVTQTGIKPTLSVSQKNILLQTKDKQEFSLDIQANFPIVFDLPDWISEKAGNQWENGVKSYGFTASPLPADQSSREGWVTVNAANAAIEIQPVLVSIIQKEVHIPKVIAHRGFWNRAGSAQNSINSLEGAIAMGAYGSETDVYITTDDVLVINHDPSFNGVVIETSPYSAIKDFRLSNGEPIPLLEQFIEVLKKQDQTKLILEIKPHSTVANENRAVAAIVKLVNDSGVAHLVDYISFSANICNELIKANPQNRVAYLNGDKTPEQLKAEGYWGLDYDINTLKSRTGWISQARSLGLTTNVWTVNSTADMQFFINFEVDFITTDYPLDLKNYLNTLFVP